MPTPEPEEVVIVASPNMWQQFSKAMCGLVEVICGPQRVMDPALENSRPPSTTAVKESDPFEFSSLMQCFTQSTGNDSETALAKGQAPWWELAGVAAVNQCVTPIIEAKNAMLADLPEPDAAAEQQQAKVEIVRATEPKMDLEIAESAPATPAEKAAELHRQGLRHNKQGRARPGSNQSGT